MTGRRGGPDPGRRLRYLLRQQLRKIAESGTVDTGSFADAISWRIRESGMTALEIARATGATKATVNGWAQKRYLPQSFFLPALALAMGCSIEELYFIPDGSEEASEL